MKTVEMELTCLKVFSGRSKEIAIGGFFYFSVEKPASFGTGNGVSHTRNGAVTVANEQRKIIFTGLLHDAEKLRNRFLISWYFQDHGMVGAGKSASYPKEGRSRCHSNQYNWSIVIKHQTNPIFPFRAQPAFSGLESGLKFEEFFATYSPPAQWMKVHAYESTRGQVFGKTELLTEVSIIQFHFRNWRWRHKRGVIRESFQDVSLESKWIAWFKVMWEVARRWWLLFLCLWLRISAQVLNLAWWRPRKSG